MNLLILIPARGGSKGFPGKNLALVAGIPLVGRAARLGRQCLKMLGTEGRVVCSTDDPAIAEAAREWGAGTPFLRPAELATDEAKSLDVVRHALDHFGEDFDAVVFLQPTSPLTEAEDVLGAIELFRNTGGPVVSVCPAGHPLEWHHRMDADGRLVPVLPTPDAHQRQKAEPAFRPNGAVYVATPAQVRESGFWTATTHGFVMPSERSVDVDTARDLELARGLLAVRPLPDLEIAGRKIGPGHPCFIIAEAGVNHNGSLDMALKLMDAAADAGADAVKFQTFKAQAVVTRDAPKAAYQKETTKASESQFEMIKKLELSDESHYKLAEHAKCRGLIFLSTPFDEGSADFLESLEVPAFKIPSGELTNMPFLGYIARKGLPMIISTGMATLKEVDAAVSAIRAEGRGDIALLHCVSNYPAAPADVNLRAMATLREAFSVPVGYSDHTLGIEVPLAAVALGACTVEKHFTLDQSLPGPDHKASANPRELAALVVGIRKIEAALGTGVKEPSPSEADTARVARRSLVAVRGIPKGAVVEPNMVGARRPGTGMTPDRAPELLGRRAVLDVAEGTLLAPEMFE